MFEQLYSRGEAYCDRLRRFTRPLCIVAHHDDEISIAGLLQRLAAPCQIVWVTNSDGLYFESDLQPEAYGRLRMQEGEWGNPGNPGKGNPRESKGIQTQVEIRTLTKPA
ncbi:MAG: hypothetical protein ABI333_17150 [bacterium]